MITVTVIYAKPTKQHLIKLLMPVDATIEMCIQSSGLMQQFPEIDLSINKVGIFSKLAMPSQTVKNGDRIEIYRPLLADPKERRRQRAKQTKNLSDE